MTSALIRQVCLLKLTQAVKTKELLCQTVFWIVTVTGTLFYSVNTWNPSHTHTSFPTHALTHRATCLKSFFENGKGKRCHNLAFPSWYQCPVSIHPWVYWLSLPVFSNLSQLLWLWLLPKPWLRVFRLPSCIELEKQRCLASPNKDISPLNKSMLTVCLPRLGDSPTLWFLIRHVMRRGEIGIWAEDCCMG